MHRPRPLITIFLTVFIDLLGFGIVIPLLPIYSKAFDASEFELGILFACYSGMQFIFAPFWGRISDRIGRKIVLIGGLFGTAISYVVFAQAQSMTLLFLSRSLAGFFGANISTAHAYIADVTSPEDRAKGMGLIGAAFGLGFTVGPLLGGELVGFSMASPGYFAAALSFFAAVFGIFNLREPQRHRAEAARIFGMDTLISAAKDQRIGVILLLYFLSILSFSGFEAMFIRFGLAKFPATFHVPQAIQDATLEQVLAAAPIAGRYMFFIGLISALIQGGFIRRLVPRFGETKLIIAGPLFLALSFSIIGVASQWWIVILGCVFMPFGIGLNHPSLTGLVSRATPIERQGAFLGLNQSLGSLARVLGPLLAGYAFEKFGPASPFFIGTVILILAAFVARNYRRRYRESFAQ